MSIGTRIDEAGTLLAEGEDVLLRRDAGGRYRLDLRRVSAPPHGARARVRVTGVLVEADLVGVDAVTAERSAA